MPLICKLLNTVIATKSPKITTTKANNRGEEKEEEKDNNRLARGANYNTGNLWINFQRRSCSKLASEVFCWLEIHTHIHHLLPL